MYTLEWWGVALILLAGYIFGYFVGKAKEKREGVDNKTFLEMHKYEVDRKYQAEILKHQMDISGMKKKEKENNAVQED